MVRDSFPKAPCQEKFRAVQAGYRPLRWCASAQATTPLRSFAALTSPSAFNGRRALPIRLVRSAMYLWSRTSLPCTATMAWAISRLRNGRSASRSSSLFCFEVLAGVVLRTLKRHWLPVILVVHTNAAVIIVVAVPMLAVPASSKIVPRGSILFAVLWWQTWRPIVALRRRPHEALLRFRLGPKPLDCGRPEIVSNCCRRTPELPRRILQ